MNNTWSFVLVIAVLFLLVGCIPIASPPRDAFPIVSSAEDAASWVRANVEYQSDMEQYGESEYWATPEETLKSGQGDCEDQALLFLRIVKESLGIEGEVHVTKIKATGKYHAKGVVGGVECYPMEGESLVFTMTYRDAMNKSGVSTTARSAYAYHTD